jgi:hypothetical protein
MSLMPVWTSDVDMLRLEFQDKTAKPVVTLTVKRDAATVITAARIVPKTTFAQIAAVLISEFWELLDEGGMGTAYKQAMIDSQGK